MSKAFGEGYKYLTPQWRFFAYRNRKYGALPGPLRNRLAQRTQQPVWKKWFLEHQGWQNWPEEFFWNSSLTRGSLRQWVGMALRESVCFKNMMSLGPVFFSPWSPPTSGSGERDPCPPAGRSGWRGSGSGRSLGWQCGLSHLLANKLLLS